MGPGMKCEDGEEEEEEEMGKGFEIRDEPEA